MSNRKTIFVAVDIESTGAFVIKNAINSIGFWIGDDVGNTITKQKFNIEVVWPTTDNGIVVDYGDFEPKCWEEFWSKLPAEKIEECKANTKPKKEAWNYIRDFINGLESEFPEQTHNIVFATDNGSFDIAFINYALELYTDRAPMRYSNFGRYRRILQADDAFKTLPEALNKSEWDRISAIVKHDHDPVNDAHCIYLMAVSVTQYRKNIGWTF